MMHEYEIIMKIRGRSRMIIKANSIDEAREKAESFNIDDGEEIIIETFWEEVESIKPCL